MIEIGARYRGKKRSPFPDFVATVKEIGSVSGEECTEPFVRFSYVTPKGRSYESYWQLAAFEDIWELIPPDPPAEAT